MANDSALFRTRSQLEREGFVLDGNVFRRSDNATYLPLYEAKMIHHFDHRFATYDSETTIRNTLPEERLDPAFLPLPRYWVSEEAVEARLEKRDAEGKVVWRWTQPWLLGFRDIARSTDERTAIFAIIQRVAVNHKFPLVFLEDNRIKYSATFTALTSSLAFDYLVRHGVGGTSLSYFVLKQIAVPPPGAITEADQELLAQLALRLSSDVVTSLGLVSVVADARRDDLPTRSAIRAELDALCFRIFGLSRDEVEHVLDTFTVLKAKEVNALGFYATREAILSRLNG